MSQGVSEGTVLALIGGGRMGEAIVAGLVRSGVVPAAAIVVAEPDASRRSVLAEAYEVSCVERAADAIPGADVVLIAVKPQVFADVVSEVAEQLAGSLVISIAAGISCARIESMLPPGTAVIRVMPNTPALVGEGMALVSGGTEATPAHVDLAVGLFGAVGEARVVEERYQDAGTAISGSGPAYFALVVDALARAGVSQGLSREVAQALAVRTMAGTARLLEETGMHPSALMDGVASPGGTTIAALERLEAGGVRAAFAEAVAAAVRRSRELGS